MDNKQGKLSKSEEFRRRDLVHTRKLSAGTLSTIALPPKNPRPRGL